jgi:hypothetical protein
MKGLHVVSISVTKGGISRLRALCTHSPARLSKHDLYRFHAARNFPLRAAPEPPNTRDFAVAQMVKRIEESPKRHASPTRRPAATCASSFTMLHDRDRLTGRIAHATRRGRRARLRISRP